MARPEPNNDARSAPPAFDLATRLQVRYELRRAIRDAFTVFGPEIAPRAIRAAMLRNEGAE